MLGEFCFQMPIKLTCLITVFQELYFFNLQILKTELLVACTQLWKFPLHFNNNEELCGSKNLYTFI